LPSASSHAAYELRVGVHAFRFEPPDLFISDIRGDASTDEINEVTDELERFARRGTGKIFLVSHLSNLGVMTAEGRRAMMRVVPLLAGAVYIGASVRVRVTFSLVRKAAVLLHRIPDFPMIFMNSEAEARAWVEAQRLRDGLRRSSANSC